MNAVPCKSCKRLIVFLKSAKRERTYVPIDAGTVQEGDTHYDPLRHVSHYTTCDQLNRVVIESSPGISLRDYFAALASEGLIKHMLYATDPRWPDALAKRAYEVADAMIAERSKE